jgi:predicted GNAT superfamily acetyltransferase
MLTWIKDTPYQLRILDKMEDMIVVEELQRLIWPGNETEVVPGHILITIAHNGGVVIGAFPVSNKTIRQMRDNDDHEFSGEFSPPPPHEMIGFVFGFPGLHQTPQGLRLKHCSHQLGVLPNYRDRGIGFILKRAQWQMVRAQGLDLITWTYDPLQSRNANLNICCLGAICNTYIRDAYGEMKDGLNAGLSSDRFQVEWWVNSHRVQNRLSRSARQKLDLAHYLAAGAEIINPTIMGEDGIPHPNPILIPTHIQKKLHGNEKPALLLVEIPSDINIIKNIDLPLAQKWRLYTRALFEKFFTLGYIISDFIYLSGTYPRSFYVLSNGEETL